MTDPTITLDMSTIAAAVGLLFGGGGLIGLASKVYSLARKIDDAQPKIDCQNCKQERLQTEAELRADLERKASSEAFIRLEGQVLNLIEKVDQLSKDVRSLLQQRAIPRTATPLPGRFEEE